MINDFEQVGPLGQLNPEERDIHSDIVPNKEHEFVYAKSFLQQCSTNTGENLYDHLSTVLNQILSERPQNVVDFFEEYSRKVKERQYRLMTDHLEDVFVPSRRLKQANHLLPLLKVYIYSYLEIDFKNFFSLYLLTNLQLWTQIIYKELICLTTIY